MCPRCQSETLLLLDTPPGSSFQRVCKPCVRFLWAQHDKEQGLEDVPVRTGNGRKQRHRNEPTERHERIAQIARALGANVTPGDVKLVFEADRVEYEERTGKVAAGGRR